MPFINVKTNTTITNESELKIKSQLGEAIKLIGKSEAWLMINFEDKQKMYFRGDKKNNKNISLNEPVGFDKEGNEITFLDILKTPKPDFAMDIHNQNNLDLLGNYFTVLTEREKKIVEKRYGLNGKDELTQKEIAKEYNVEPEQLLNYLPILSNYRNLCAHEDILFEHRTQKLIPDNKFHDLLNIPSIDGQYIYGKGDLFSVVFFVVFLVFSVTKFCGVSPFISWPLSHFFVTPPPKFCDRVSS